MTKSIDRRQTALKRSVEAIVTGADFLAAARITKEADGEAAKAGMFGTTGHGLEIARIVHEEIEKALPAIFAAYNAERSHLWTNHHRLDGIARRGIAQYWEDAERHQPNEKGIFGTAVMEFDELLQERRKVMDLQVEEHFRHPGLSPPHQRYAIAFGLIMLVLGGSFALVLRLTFPSN